MASQLDRVKAKAEFNYKKRLREAEEKRKFDDQQSAPKAETNSKKGK